MDANELGAGGSQFVRQSKTGRTRLRSTITSGDCVPFTGHNNLSAWLLLVLYPLALPLGTVPVMVGDNQVSAEFLFAILCVLIVVMQAGLGSLKIKWGNQYCLLGLAVWLGANVLSLLFHPDQGTGMMVFRMLLKALFGYMVFLVLMHRGRLNSVLRSYVAGCAAAGLFTVVYCVQSGSLEALRQASYGGLNPNGVELDVFRGIARAGAGNLLPVWISIVLYMGEPRKSRRAILLASMPYFAVLAFLALRREVMIEAAVGFLILLFAVPRKFRTIIGVVGIILACSTVILVANSERWQERLFTETRDKFAALEDPRLVLLVNTPAELKDQPLLGHGPGSYPRRMSRYFSNAAAVPEGGIAAHNSFSRAAVETGALGLLGFTLMVVALGWRAVRRRSKIALPGSMTRLTAIMIFLHVGDWIFFGDGIALNTTWYFIGLLLYLERSMFFEDIRGLARAYRGFRLRHEAAKVAMI